MERELLRPRPPVRANRPSQEPKLPPVNPFQVAEPKGADMVLGDDAIMALARRADVIKAFPFIRTLAAKAVKVRTCCNAGGKLQQSRKNAANLIKHAILSFNPAQRELFKRLLKANSVTIYLPSATGVKTHTI